MSTALLKNIAGLLLIAGGGYVTGAAVWRINPDLLWALLGVAAVWLGTRFATAER